MADCSSTHKPFINRIWQNYKFI